MRDRELPQRMRAQTDQRAHLAVFAVGVAGELERVQPLDDVLCSAATADPGSLGQGACRTTCSKQHAAMITVVRWITTRGPLRGGTDAARAADLRWTLTNPEAHHTLLEVRGWTREQYGTWLRQTPEHALLGP